MGTPCSQNQTPALPITQKPHLDALSLFSIFYVVHENKDYHGLMGDVIDLVKVYINRESLGISNVNNTSDIDKPISNEQREEFNRLLTFITELRESKADRNSVPTLIQFNELVQVVESCVKRIPYETQINEILQLLASIRSWSESEINQLIDLKLEAIRNSLQTIEQSIADLPNIYVTKTSFNAYVASIANELLLLNNTVNNHETRISFIEDKMGEFVTARDHQW